MPQTAAAEAASAVGMTVTAKMRGEEEEDLNMRAVFFCEGKREDSEEDQLWCDLQEEVLELTGSIINTGRTYA